MRHFSCECKDRQIPRTNVNAVNAELVRRPTCNSSVWKVEARDLQRKLVSKIGQAGELWAQKTCLK